MLPEWYDLNTHCHVLGATQSGKSKFLEHCARRLLKHNHGFCVIDWHGTLYEHILSYLAAIDCKKPVILLNPSRADFIVPYNPFQRRSGEISSQASRMVNSIQRVWREEASNERPTFERIATMTVYLGLSSEEPIQHVTKVLRYHRPELREYAIRSIDDENMKDEWRELESWPKRDWLQQVLSTKNRLERFLSHKGIVRFMGHKEGNLDISKVIDDGAILLVNLANSDYLDDKAASMFATLLLDDFFHCAMRRVGSPTPYFLLLDEAYNYISKFTGSMLDQVVKTGLRVTIVHHHSGQTPDAHLKGSLKTNARIKVVFGGVEYEDATDLVNNYFLAKVNEKMVKEERTHTITRHLLEEYEELSESEQHGKRRGKSLTQSTTTSESDVDNYNDNWIEAKRDPERWDIVEKRLGGGMGNSTVHQESETSGRALHVDHSTLRGQAVKHGTRYAPYTEKELTGHEFYTREEKVSIFAEQLVNQEKRHCVVLLPQRLPKAREVPPIKYHRQFVPDSPGYLEYERRLNENALPASVADSRIEEGERRFLLEVERNAHHRGNGTGRPKRKRRDGNE